MLPAFNLRRFLWQLHRSENGRGLFRQYSQSATAHDLGREMRSPGIWAVWVILAAIAISMWLMGCEGTKAGQGVNVTLNGQPAIVYEGTKILTRDPKSGRFIIPQFINP